MEKEACRDGMETKGRFSLKKDGIWTARNRRTGGMAVICRSGRLWVTWEAGEDRILEAGESLRVDGTGLVVIQGMEGSRVEVCRKGRN